MDYSLPGSSFQARILEWVAISFSRRSSWARDQTCCLSLFLFNWRIVALQYCVGFCHTSTWISHMSPPSRTSLPSHLIPPLCVVSESQFEFPESHRKFPVAIYFTYSSVYVSMLPSPFIPLSPSHPLYPQEWGSFKSKQPPHPRVQHPQQVTNEEIMLTLCC